MFNWYPIKRLVRIDIREDLDDILNFNLYRMFYEPKRQYVAICEHKWFRQQTFEVILPDNVIHAMKDENGMIFEVKPYDQNSWKSVEDRINEAALRVINSYNATWNRERARWRQT